MTQKTNTLTVALLTLLLICAGSFSTVYAKGKEKTGKRLNKPVRQKSMPASFMVKPGFRLSRESKTVSGRKGTAVDNQKSVSIKLRRQTVPGQLIVKYKNARLPKANREAFAERHKLKQKKYIRFADLYVYKIQDVRDHKKILHQLRNNPAVKYAEPDYIVRADAVPNDTYFGDQWGFHEYNNESGVVDQDIDAIDAWDINTGSNTVVVAVIDSGVDYYHEDLSANMWTNPGETPGDSIDNDGNGFVDDVYGIDAITGTGDPMDDESHGTHCAGTIGAAGNNGMGTTGVCWNVKLMALRFMDNTLTGSTSDAVTCIQYAIDNGADVICASWGGVGDSTALSDAIESARQNGILFVTSAGNNYSDNDATPYYPASYSHDNIISVAAYDRNKKLYTFSNYGAASVDVAAPGEEIFSTAPGHMYDIKSGTSTAAPFVAGLAALIKSNDPSRQWWEIKARILDTVETDYSMDGKTLTGGSISAYYALNYNAPPSVTITAPGNLDIVSGTIVITVDAADSDGLTKVEFYIDGSLESTDTGSPFSYSWNTAASGDGSHIVKAIAYDTGGRTSETQIKVSVNNSGLPVVIITAPESGFEARSTVSILANASYAGGIDRVEFYIDSNYVGQDATAPFQFDWDSTTVTNGSRTLEAIVIGSDAQTGSDTVTVTVDNIDLPAAERNALIALYNNTAGDSWTIKTNWKKPGGSFNDPGTEHSWHGVTIENNHVVRINLGDNYLNGTLPPEIGDFPNLTELILFNNLLSGTIPTQIGNLSLLEYLDLEENSLVGPIPDSIGNLNQLQVLWLNDNVFDSPIPAAFGNLTNLEYLYMWNCRITGTIPPEFGNMAKLKVAALYWNIIIGPLPSELGNLNQLNYLDLHGNWLYGSIPVQMGNLSNLTNLWLSANELTGTIPAEFGNLSNLKFLFLYTNKLSGSIPIELGNLNNLIELALDDNTLTGSIPTQLGNLSNLTDLDLSHNTLTGTIPTSLQNLTQLENLYLYLNKLSGGIPVEITTLPNLVNLYLSSNDLGGTIPPEIGNMPKLRGLGLSCNSLAGTIPPEIGNLSSLRSLDLFYNQLSGTLPTEISNLTHLSYLDIEANKLSGKLPDSMVNMTRLFTGTLTVKPYYNALYTDNPTLQTLMSTASGYWENSQTVAPDGIAAVANDASSVTLTWNPVVFITYPGQFHIYQSTSPGGPYVLSGSTADNITTTYTVTGLSPATTYYFVIRTQTSQHVFNFNSVISDYSQEVSAVTDAFQSITVSSPNGSETLTGCSSVPITWSSSGPVGTLTLEYSTSGVNGTYINIASGVADTGTYNWTVPDTDSTQCFIRIRDDDGYPSDESSGEFTIGACPSFTITSPNGGEYFQRGFPYTVTWDYVNVSGSATLELYKGGGLVQTIATPAADAGTYTWNIPAGLTPGNDYQIRITNGSIEDYSDTNFLVVGYKSFADFNNDGKPDILWRHYASAGENGVWYMNNTVQTGIAFFPSNSDMNWKIGGTGDFNNDGKTDILWRHYGTGANIIWYMDNATRTGWASITSVSDTNWKIRGTGDFNNDGKPDILWRHSATGDNVIWYMDNTTRTGWTITTKVSDTEWQIGGTGDFNNDGKVDILWRHTGNGDNVIWYMDNATRTGFAYINAVTDQSWRIEGTGDFNGDGYVDIIWRQYQSGAGHNVVWYMNNATYLGSDNAPQFSDLTWDIENH